MLDGAGVPTGELQGRLLIQKAMSMPSLQVSILAHDLHATFFFPSTELRSKLGTQDLDLAHRFGSGNPECSRYIRLISNYLSLHILGVVTKELIVRSKLLCVLLLVLGPDGPLFACPMYWCPLH